MNLCSDDIFDFNVFYFFWSQWFSRCTLSFFGAVYFWFKEWCCLLLHLVDNRIRSKTSSLFFQKQQKRKNFLFVNISCSICVDNWLNKLVNDPGFCDQMSKKSGCIEPSYEEKNQTAIQTSLTLLLWGCFFRWISKNSSIILVNLIIPWFATFAKFRSLRYYYVISWPS